MGGARTGVHKCGYLAVWGEGGGRLRPAHVGRGSAAAEAPCSSYTDAAQRWAGFPPLLHGLLRRQPMALIRCARSRWVRTAQTSLQPRSPPAAHHYLPQGDGHARRLRQGCGRSREAGTSTRSTGEPGRGARRGRGARAGAQQQRAAARPMQRSHRRVLLNRETGASSFF